MPYVHVKHKLRRCQYDGRHAERNGAKELSPQCYYYIQLVILIGSEVTETVFVANSIEKFTTKMTNIHGELLVMRFLSFFHSVSQKTAKTSSHLAKKGSRVSTKYVA